MELQVEVARPVDSEATRCAVKMRNAVTDAFDRAQDAIVAVATSAPGDQTVTSDRCPHHGVNRGGFRPPQDKCDPYVTTYIRMLAVGQSGAITRCRNESGTMTSHANERHVVP